MLLTRNGKMKLTGKGFYDWAIVSNPKTCPWAGECFSVCYAHDGRYQQRSVKRVHQRNYEHTLQFDFPMAMMMEIAGRRSVKVVRIHSSGDFYGPVYLEKWLRVMRALPDVRFYTYTKAVPMFKKYKALGLMPPNFTWVYSFGGKFDHLIDVDRDRLSRVFAVEADIPGGYANASHTDAPAADPAVRLIGLSYHGRFNRSLNKPTLGVTA